MDLCFVTGHKDTEKNGFVVIYALFFTTKAYFLAFVVKYRRFLGENFQCVQIYDSIVNLYGKKKKRKTP